MIDFKIWLLIYFLCITVLFNKILKEGLRHCFIYSGMEQVNNDKSKKKCLLNYIYVMSMFNLNIMVLQRNTKIEHFIQINGYIHLLLFFIFLSNITVFL